MKSNFNFSFNLTGNIFAQDTPLEISGSADVYINTTLLRKYRELVSQLIKTQFL
jgi:hypothetical protein